MEPILSVQSFENVYNTYADDLFRFVENKLRDRDGAKEIVQEIFVTLWEQRETIHVHTSLKGYLFSMARSRVLNYFRDQKIEDRYIEHFMRVTLTRDNSIEHEVDLNDLKDTIERHMHALPENCKTAFRLSRFDNLPSEQIAAEMNISHRTVENYLSRALHHLRTSLPKAMLAWLLFQNTGL